MDEFQIPEDIRSLDDEQLTEALVGATQAFQALSSQTRIDDSTMGQLRALSTCVQDIRQEQADRVAAAEAAADEIEQLAAQVRGDDPTAPVEEAPAEPTAAATEEPAEPPTAAEPQPAAEPQRTATASLARPSLDLSLVRRRQTRVLPEPPAPAPSSPPPSTSPATRRAPNSTSTRSPRASSPARTP